MECFTCCAIPVKNYVSLNSYSMFPLKEVKNELQTNFMENCYHTVIPNLSQIQDVWIKYLIAQ